MKKTVEDIFSLLNWILKKPSYQYHFGEEVPSTFMLLRWLSMSNQENAKIINQTVNRWYQNYSLYGDNVLISKFLKILLQKYTKKINYFKKITQKKTKQADEIQEHIYRECSKKEVIFQKQMLEELKKISK